MRYWKTKGWFLDFCNATGSSGMIGKAADLDNQTSWGKREDEFESLWV